MFGHWMFHSHRQEGGGCGRRGAGHFARFGGGHDRFGQRFHGEPEPFQQEMAGREEFRHGFGRGGRGRLFENGDLQLVIMHLLAEEPGYGYQLIKRLEKRLAGGYAPSPGVVYPTLTMLDEEGFATVAPSPDGKKVYTLTDAGKQHLEQNKRRLDEVLGRVDRARKGFAQGRSPELMRALMNLRGAVQDRVARRGVSPEQLEKIVEAINVAAAAVDAL